MSRRVAAGAVLAMLLGLSCSAGGGPSGSEGATEAGGSDRGQEVEATSSVGGDDGADRSAWIGRYVWEEFVDGDPGSDQTLVHELELLAEPDSGGAGLTGRFTQSGFQTATDTAVTARPIADGVAIEVVRVEGGLTSLRPGDVILRLTGDPDEPVTTLGELVPLVAERPATGAYFLRQSPAPAGPPPSFWAVEAVTYDLIEIESDTGQEIGRIAGWGADAATEEEGGGQALQRVEVAADGWLWVDDCCEPAAGNIFGLDPDRVADLDGVLQAPPDDPTARRLIGLNPIPSPDGSLIAYGNYTFDVSVVRPDGEVVASLAGGDDGQTFPTPLAWLDEVTLAVGVQGSDGETLVSFWDLASPADPVPTGGSTTVAGVIVDAAPWPGGVLVVHGPDPFGDPGREATIVGVGGAEAIEVPAGLASVDRDPTGRHILHVGADGLARSGDLDDASEVLSPIEVIWASW